jgi:hypothetical protein
MMRGMADSVAKCPMIKDAPSERQPN